VDGYDPEKNVVIEFYEKKSHKGQEEKDKIRQNTIQDFLGCEFIILREGSDEVKNLEDRLMVI
jgi:very-short-patch-repair endonuclease